MENVGKTLLHRYFPYSKGALTCHLRNPETFAEQKAGLGSEERSRGRQPTERAIRYNQEINLLYPCASEIIHHRHYIPK